MFTLGRFVVLSAHGGAAIGSIDPFGPLGRGLGAAVGAQRGDAHGGEFTLYVLQAGEPGASHSLLGGQGKRDGRQETDGGRYRVRMARTRR